MQGVAWEIRKPGANPGEDGPSIDTKYDPVPRFVIPAGDYVMRLTKDRAKAEKSFSLAAGDSVNIDLSLDIGRAIVKAVYAPGGPEVKSGVAFSISKPPGIEGGDGERVDTLYDAESNFGVPAGKYRLKAEVGRAVAYADVEVKSGAAARVEIVMNAGVLGWKGAPTESVTSLREGRSQWRPRTHRHAI